MLHPAAQQDPKGAGVSRSGFAGAFCLAALGLAGWIGCATPVTKPGAMDLEVLEACPRHVAVPMLGIKESFNVAVAFGITAYHAARALRGRVAGGASTM